MPTLIVTFTLLTIAILALWSGADESRPLARAAWLLPLVAALGAALAGGIITPIALVWIGGFGAATFAFSQAAYPRSVRRVAFIGLVVLAAGLMTHQLPGFNNPRVIAAQQFTTDAIPFRLHLNIDKTVVGIFLLGFCHPRIRRFVEWRAMFSGAAPIAIGLIAGIMILALALGYVRFDPKFPREAWLWLWVNLCFTCMAEEAVFRGFIQRELQQRWRGLRHGSWSALVVAAVLFGLAHAAGGVVYVLLASIAGAGYGWVYLRTGRIEASILTHFALNATHFIGFTYPALVPRG